MQFPHSIAAALARAATAALVLLAVGCIQVVQTAPPQEPEPRTPPALTSLEDPKLVPTGVEGLFAAPALDPMVFFYEPEELWYRYAFRKWFQAFRWDGAWFVPEKVPDVVKARAPEESPATLKDQLKDLDKKLEDLDKEEKLKQLERKLEELDKNEAAPKGGAQPPSGPARDAKPPAPGTNAPSPR